LLPTRRILDKVLAVPHELSSIKLVAKDTGLAACVPKDERRGPSATARARNIGVIEAARYLCPELMIADSWNTVAPGTPVLWKAMPAR
jgi:hypothetical protein